MTEIDVLYLGILKYKDKQTQEDKYRISYILNSDGAKTDTQHFKGVQEFGYFIDNPIAWETLKKEDAMTSMKFIIENRPSTRNPLKTVTVLKAIKSKNANIELL